MTTTPTASPELLDLAACPFCGGTEAFVERADYSAAFVVCDSRVDEHSVCMARGPIGIQDDDGEEIPGQAAAIREWNKAAALARRVQPEGEGDAIARSKRILNLVDEYVEQQTAGRRTALRCALMDQFSRDITPHQLLEVARATGLRQFLHGVNATDARQLLADFVAAVPAAACGVQQAAAPGALAERWSWSKRGMELDTNGHYAAYSAPGTPEASADAIDAARYRYIRDTGTIDAAVWAALEGYGLAESGELDQAEYAVGMDRAIDKARAAQLDGGQGETR